MTHLTSTGLTAVAAAVVVALFIVARVAARMSARASHRAYGIGHAHGMEVARRLQNQAAGQPGKPKRRRGRFRLVLVAGIAGFGGYEALTHHAKAAVAAAGKAATAKARTVVTHPVLPKPQVPALPKTVPAPVAYHFPLSGGQLTAILIVVILSVFAYLLNRLRTRSA